ncbi:MAG: hypothetical protein ABIG69_06440 [Bacteroidota bacterium]
MAFSLRSCSAASFTCSSVAYPTSSQLITSGPLNAQSHFVESYEIRKAENKKLKPKEIRKPFKAESYAQQMLREIVGFDEWMVYRRTNRVIVAGNYNWLIGNVLGNYNKFNPLLRKPDVVRLDGKRKIRKGWQATSFCIISESKEELPYTDKVLAFASHCLNDEKEFYKIANRIGEKIFNKIPECAIFN